MKELKSTLNKWETGIVNLREQLTKSRTEFAAMEKEL